MNSWRFQLARFSRTSWICRDCPAASFATQRSFGSLTIRKNRESLNLQLLPEQCASGVRAKNHIPENARHTSRVMHLGRARRWTEAKELFDRVPEKNIILYTAMITAAEHCKMYEEGLGIFEQLKGMPFYQPNAATYGAVLSILGHQGQYTLAHELWKEMVLAGIGHDSPTCLTGLLNAAAVAKDTDAVRRHLHEAKSRGMNLNHVHYGCLVKAYREEGSAWKALQVIKDMREKLKPTIILYTMALGACSRATLHGQLGQSCVDDFVAQLLSQMALDGISEDKFFVEEQLCALLGGRRLESLSELTDRAATLPTSAQIQAALSALQRARDAGVDLTRLLKTTEQWLLKHCSPSGSLPTKRLASAPMENNILPTGWHQALDQNSRRWYYWHVENPIETVTWRRPS